MTSRYRQLERLQAAARRRLPQIAPAWLAPLRAEIERLTRAAARGTLTDAALLRRIQALHDRAPKLIAHLDPTPLATALEQAMISALLNGITSGPRPPTTARASTTGQPAITLKAGKKCGNSWIPDWKQCRLKVGSIQDILVHIREGRTGNYIAEGKPLSSRAYGMVKRHAPALAKTARPMAHEQDIRHILKNHAAELSPQDWASVLLGPQKGDHVRSSRTAGKNPAIEVWSRRGDRWLLKVYRIESNALALHTMKRKKEK